MNYECSTFCTHKIFYLHSMSQPFPCKKSGYVRLVDEATLSIWKSKQKEAA